MEVAPLSPEELQVSFDPSTSLVTRRVSSIMALQSVLGFSHNPTFRFADDGKIAQDNLFEELEKQDHVQLPLYPHVNSVSKDRLYVDGSTGRSIKMNFKKGTTTLAFKYQGGVVIAADSRSTGGQHIHSNSVMKILPISKYLVGTMAGGAADCSYWERVLAQRCRLYELRNRERMSTAAASKLLANIIYNYRGMGLSLGVMLCGWDKKGPGLYMVNDEGERSPGNMYSVGSGSPYAYGVLDNGYSYNMTDEQAYDLARRAIFHAGHRDAMSGGIVRVYVVKSTGWERISEEDCTELYYKYQKEKEEEEMA